MAKFSDTEKKALAWIKKQGYKDNEIVYQPKASPDFVLPNGKGIEVKKSSGKRITFTATQLAKLEKMKDVQIAVFETDDSPDTVFPSSELRLNSIINGYFISCGLGSKRRRESKDIKAQVLTLCHHNPQRKTFIMQQVNLNPEVLNQILNDLLRAGLLICSKPWRYELFQTTAKGLQTIKIYDHLVTLLKTKEN